MREGMGKNESLLEYSEYLADKYNIVFHHQVLRSLETNMLDLGSCMTMKSKVKIFHCRNAKQHNALARSVKKAWCDM